MFISIRNYHGVRSVDEVRRRVEREFVPALRENPGLLGHYLVDCASPESGNIVASISMFDSWDSALASNDAARTFVRRTCCPSRPRRSAAG